MKKPAKPKIQFHKNLNLNRWSWKPEGEPTSHCDVAVLEGVIVKHPSPGNKQFILCLEGGSRKVFALFKATRIKVIPDNPLVERHNFAAMVLEGGERIHFDPTKGDTFFHFRRNGKKVKVDTLSKVWAFDDSEIFGVL